MSASDHATGSRAVAKCQWRLSECKEPPLKDARYCAEHARFRMAVAAIRNDGWPGERADA